VASQNLTYTINFVNNGPSSANSVTVTDAVPANTTFVSAVVTTGSGWSISAPAVGGTGNVIFSKSPVAGGETAVFTIVVNVNTATPNGTVITNSATAASTTADGTSGNNTSTTTTTVVALADLAVTKSDSPDPACSTRCAAELRPPKRRPHVRAGTAHSSNSSSATSKSSASRHRSASRSGHEITPTFNLPSSDITVMFSPQP